MPGGHGVQFTTAGNVQAPYGPVALPGIQQVVRVYGISVENTSITASAVVIRDGGASGPIVWASPNIPAIAGSVPGTADANFAVSRAAMNGLYVEIDGAASGVSGTIWVL